MQQNPEIIPVLNTVLTLQLTSINHYFLHARMYRNWGFENLNHRAYKKSIRDMKQADALIERILMLEGLPNLQKLNALEVGEHTEDMLKCDVGFQQSAIALLKHSIAACETQQDYVSRNLLEDILENEEDYLDWVETQQYQITNMGIKNYLQAQISEGEG